MYKLLFDKTFDEYKQFMMDNKQYHIIDLIVLISYRVRKVDRLTITQELIGKTDKRIAGISKKFQGVQSVIAPIFHYFTDVGEIIIAEGYAYKQGDNENEIVIDYENNCVNVPNMFDIHLEDRDNVRINYFVVDYNTSELRIAVD